MHLRPTLGFQDSDAILTACLSAAQDRNVNVSIAVVDDAGALLHFVRMDGARAYTVELALKKARAAAAVGVATRIIAQFQPDTERGAEPVLHQGQCAGAVGISGAKPDVDEAIAACGVAVVKTA